MYTQNQKEGLAHDTGRISAAGTHQIQNGLLSGFGSRYLFTVIQWGRIHKKAMGWVQFVGSLINNQWVFNYAGNIRLVYEFT